MNISTNANGTSPTETINTLQRSEVILSLLDIYEHPDEDWKSIRTKASFQSLSSANSFVPGQHRAIRDAESDEDDDDANIHSTFEELLSSIKMGDERPMLKR